MTALLALALVIAAGPAAAHHDPSAYASIDVAWTYDLRVVVPLYGSALLYLVGTFRLWRRAGQVAPDLFRHHVGQGKGIIALLPHRDILTGASWHRRLTHAGRSLHIAYQ